jgi:hypothetical protein
MPIFLVEPRQQRIAIAAPSKVACCSMRFWLYEIGYGHTFSSGAIFRAFAPHVYAHEHLPSTVEITIALHRDGPSRLRAVYDHRIRHAKQCPDYGIDHFARNLPEYVARYRAIAHHAAPQSRWLGSNLQLFTHIVPLSQAKLLPQIVATVLGQPPPPLPRHHATERKTPISPAARAGFEAWTAHDTLLGWDGIQLQA